MTPEHVTGGIGDRAESWPVHSTEDVWKGGAPFSVHRDTIASPERPDEQFARLVVAHPGAAVVLALDEQERVLVVQQYRHPARIRFVELPAGLLDVDNEDPMVAAKRELQEEAQYQAGSWQHLITTHPSPGLSSERIEIYLATDLTPADRGDFALEHEEADMTVSWVPLDALLDAVLTNQVTDGPLALAVLVYDFRFRRGNTLSRSPRRRGEHDQNEERE